MKKINVWKQSIDKLIDFFFGGGGVVKTTKKVKITKSKLFHFYDIYLYDMVISGYLSYTVAHYSLYVLDFRFL